jgi:pimeloyl-ACP methyl ester carboxylesterase
MHLRETQINDVYVHWEEEGDGHPVVLIHGIPSTPKLWRHVIPYLKEAAVYAWELVGYGDSMQESWHHDISVARQADYLIAWMDALNIRRAVLVGHDLGGGVAQIVAVKHPQRVAGLVLSNAICYDSWPVPIVRAIQKLEGVIKHIPDFLFRGLYALVQRYAHDNKLNAEDAVRTHLPYYLKADGAAALSRQAKALHTEDTLAIVDRLPHLEVPAELVWGAADPFQSIDYAERLAADLRAPLDRIEGASHFVPEDHPERTAAAINRVLLRV